MPRLTKEQVRRRATALRRKLKEAALAHDRAIREAAELEEVLLVHAATEPVEGPEVALAERTEEFLMEPAPRRSFWQRFMDTFK